MKKNILTAIAILTFATISYARMEGGPKDTPPQEAIDICVNKSQGDECLMKSPQGDQLKGTCRTTPDEKYFACMPEGAPKR